MCDFVYSALVDERCQSPLDVAQKQVQTETVCFLKEKLKEQYVIVDLNVAWSGEKLLLQNNQRNQQQQDRETNHTSNTKTVDVEELKH
jgi:hypothetical protein